MKYLSAEIIKSRYHSSNHGISDKLDTVYVPHPEGNYKREDIDPEAILDYDQRGNPSFMNPIFTPEGNPDEVGWMASGAFVYSSDGRFRKLYGSNPIPLHDRQESYELYKALSV